MAVNKVEFGGETLIDLTNDTVTEDTLLEGATAHDKSGRQISGGAVIGKGNLTIKRNGVSVGSFNANETTNKEIDITVHELFVATYGETTFEQVATAVESGSIVQLWMEGGLIFPLSVYSEGEACLFVLSEPTMSLAVFLYANDVWESAEIPHADATVLDEHLLDDTRHFTADEKTVLSKIEFESNDGGNHVTIESDDLHILGNKRVLTDADAGVSGGVASLDTNGKVPSSQLPSYVDDVLEYSAKSSFPTTGESGKIYIDKATNKTYRWSGTAYAEISASLALGETSSTAYAGDKGKEAHDLASAALPKSGGTMTRNAAIKYPTVNNRTPFFGYCTQSSDGTFIIMSLDGTVWNTGLAIGGSSGNLLWKGAKIATASDIPSVPSVGNGTLTIKKNGVDVGTFSANQSGAASVNISVPINIETDGESQNDVAVIGAEYARLSNGKDLVTPDDVTAQIGAEAALKSEGIFYIEGTGSTVGKWLGASTRFTEPYDGLAIRYKIPVAGSTTTTLNINNKGEVTVYRFNDTKLTTHFEAGMIVNLIYHANYQGEGTPRWMCSDYDSNTNTYLRVYRRTNTTSNQTTYGKDFPILVSNTEASKIGTPGSNNTYAAVYGVMWDDTTKVPTLNPTTGELKAVKFTGEVTQLNQRITLVDTNHGDLGIDAVINADEVKLADGDYLVRQSTFDDFVENNTAKGVIEGKGYIIVDKAEAPTGVTISDGTSGSSTLSLMVSEDVLDPSGFYLAQSTTGEIDGNNATVRVTGTVPTVNLVEQQVSKSGNYFVRLHFEYTGTVNSSNNRENEIITWVNGTIVSVEKLTNNSTNFVKLYNINAGDTIKSVYYVSVTTGDTYENFEARLENVCFSREESFASYANNSTLQPPYNRAVVSTSTKTQNLKASYNQGLNATLDELRDAIANSGGGKLYRHDIRIYLDDMFNSSSEAYFVRTDKHESSYNRSMSSGVTTELNAILNRLFNESNYINGVVGFLTDNGGYQYYPLDGMIRRNGNTLMLMGVPAESDTGAMVGLSFDLNSNYILIEDTVTEVT